MISLNVDCNKKQLRMNLSMITFVSRDYICMLYYGCPKLMFCHSLKVISSCKATEIKLQKQTRFWIFHTIQVNMDLLQIGSRIFRGRKEKRTNKARIYFISRFAPLVALRCVLAPSVLAWFYIQLFSSKRLWIDL